MPHPGSPNIHYTIAAFNLSQDRSLLYRKTASPETLANIVKLALDKGATVISIRRIHPSPQPKLLDQTPDPSPEGSQSEKGH